MPVWVKQGRQGRHTRVRVALAVGVPVVLLLGVSQAVLPGLAVKRVRDLLEPYGRLQHVSVSAFPAVKLLWGRADRARASASSLSLDEQQAMKLTWDGRAVHDSDLSVGTLRLRVPGLPSGVVMHDVLVRKRGERLSTEGTLNQADLDAASPAGFRLGLLPSAPGTVKARVSGALFGIGASVEAIAQASGGRLIAQPLGILLGQFVQLTLFSDAHVYLDGISATPLQAGQNASWRLALSAHLR